MGTNSSPKALYVALSAWNYIKLGISYSPPARLTKLSLQGSIEWKQTYFTDPTPHAQLVEKALFRRFKAFRRKGEWLNGVTFDDARDEMLDYLAAAEMGVLELKTIKPLIPYDPILELEKLWVESHRKN